MKITKQRLKEIIKEEFEQLRERSVQVPHRPHAPRSSINLQRTKTTGTPKAPVHPAPPPPAPPAPPPPPVTLGGGTESMETILPDDVVMTREPGKSARFRDVSDDPFGEDEPIVDPERTRRIQGYLSPAEVRNWPEDHPNREQLGDLWHAEQDYLEDLTDPEAGADWAFALETDPYYRDMLLKRRPRHKVLYDEDWPAEEDLEESKQRFTALVLQELAQMRLSEDRDAGLGDLQSDEKFTGGSPEERLLTLMKARELLAAMSKEELTTLSKSLDGPTVAALRHLLANPMYGKGRRAERGETSTGPWAGNDDEMELQEGIYNRWKELIK